MITPIQMYWLTRLDEICCLFGVLGIISFVAAIICLLIWAVNNDDEDFEKFKAYGLRLVAFFVFALATMAFVPTTKQMAAIILVPRIANSEKVQMAGNKLYDLAVEWMDELKPRKNGAKEAK